MISSPIVLAMAIPIYYILDNSEQKHVNKIECQIQMYNACMQEDNSKYDCYADAIMYCNISHNNFKQPSA